MKTGKKQVARLAARIRNWEMIKDAINEKQREGYNGFQYTKSGSNKK